MTYSIHPSQELIELFKAKPYQGQAPDQATVIILGNDANYSPDISEHPFFEHVLEYHQDGVAFWKNKGVHHPFLLDDYPFNKTKGGVPYHRRIASMGFDGSYADKFSFVELLDVPTIGNTNDDKEVFWSLINIEHLNWLESILLEGDKKIVLTTSTFFRILKKLQKDYGCFKSLKDKTGDMPVMVYQENNTRIYKSYSFSHSLTKEYIHDLSKMIRCFMGEK